MSNITNNKTLLWGSSQFKLKLKLELKKLMLLWGGELSIQRFDITHYECECVIVYKKCKHNPLNLRHLSSKDLLWQ